MFCSATHSPCFSQVPKATKATKAKAAKSKRAKAQKKTELPDEEEDFTSAAAAKKREGRPGKRGLKEADFTKEEDDEDFDWATPQETKGKRGLKEMDYKKAADVTESARACSYYSISTGTQIGEPSAVPFLPPVSRSGALSL